MRYPTFNRAVESPELQRGIALAAAPEASMGDPTLPLWGSFMVPRDEASDFTGHLMRAAVVLVRTPGPITIRPGGGQMLLADDLADEGELIRGHFAIDLFQTLGRPEEPVLLRLSATILGHLSNHVSIEVS
jgi:hypothetical protein